MTTRWTLITDAAPWPPRDSPGAVVFRDRMWLLGGFQSDRAGNFTRLNDVWSSQDGIAWEQVLGQAPWEPRNLAGCVVFRDRIWLLGGFSGTRTFGDVWSSRDGVDWKRHAEEAPWGARGAFGCVVHDGRMWVIGGVNWESQTHGADVWCSADGDRWTQVRDGAAWGPRAMCAAVALESGIWLMGGGLYHDREASDSDVWCAADGAAWRRIVGAAQWSPRRFHQALFYRGAFWVLGGAAAGSVNLNDVWSSPDGVHWTCTDPHAPWGIRHAFGLLEFHGKAWLLGGFSGEIAGNIIYNDIWTMEIGNIP